MTRWRRIAGGVLVGAWLLVGLLSMVGVSWNRAFQVDEVEHLHAGYHMAEGRTIYTDFWQPHNPLLYVLLGPLADPGDPVASYRAGRLLMLALLLSTLFLTAFSGALLAKKLTDPGSGTQESISEAFVGTGAWGGLLAGGMVLFHSTMVERGIEVRPDGVLAFCIAAALAIELSGRLDDRWRHSLAGLFLGFGFLATQKAVFACFAFGCLWLARAIRRRCPGRVLWPMIAWSLPLALAVGLMGRAGNFDAYLQLNILDAFDTVSGAEHRSPFPPTRFLGRESIRNPAFVLLVMFGLVRGLGSLAASAKQALRRAEGRERQADGELSPTAAIAAFPAYLAWLSLLSLWATPFPWPYVHVAVIPPLAVLAGATVAALLVGKAGARRAWAGPAFVAILLALPILSAPRLASKALPVSGPGGQEFQFAHLREIDRILGPEDRVFDLAGLYFRPDGYRQYALSSDLFGWYRAGGLPSIPASLAENENAAIVLGYRTSWLGPELAFVSAHYTPYYGNILLLGRTLSGAPTGIDLPIDILSTREYRYEGPGTLLVDGQPFVQGVLEKGRRILRLDTPSDDARLILNVPPGDRPHLEPGILYINFD